MSKQFVSVIVWVWLPIFFFSATELILAQENVPKDDGAKCSIFRVALAYAEAVDSYDVLMLERRTYVKLKTRESPSEGELSEFVLSRTVFDQALNRALVSSRTKSEWLELDKVERQNQGRTVKVAEFGSLIDYENQKISHKRGNNLREMPWMPHLAVFEDVRSAGLGGARFGSFDLARQVFASMATGDSLLDSLETEKALELRINMVREEEAKVNHVRHFYFDKKTHLPVRCQSYVEFDSGGRTQPEDFYFEWKEISNIYVPVKIKARACRSYRGPDREECDGILSTEFYLDWLLINEPLPASRFETANLTDSKKFRDSIDPVKNNAVSIIDILEKEKAEAIPRDER